MRRSEKIIYIKKIIPDAYHGTSLEVSNEIVQTREFEISTGNHQYFGDGVYFFESQDEYAKRWAKNRFGNKCRIGIIRAVIDLGRCFNLTIPKFKRLYLTIKGELQKFQNGKLSDAAVINYIAVNIVKPEPDTIKGLNIGYDGKKLSERIYARDEIIICVRNLRNILDCELAYTC